MTLLDTPEEIFPKRATAFSMSKIQFKGDDNSVCCRVIDLFLLKGTFRWAEVDCFQRKLLDIFCIFGYCIWGECELFKCDDIL